MPRHSIGRCLALGMFLVTVLASVAALSAPARTIYLVPVGKFTAFTVDELKLYYRQRFDISIETLPLLPFDQVSYDTRRHQLIAEEVVAQIKRRCPKQAADENAIVIGLTDGDMYIRQMDWQFAFNYRADARFAVLSCARMDPVNFGEPADKELLRSRVRKMVTKNIGLTYFKKSASTDPKSVLYNNVLGLEDLDNMGEEF